MKKHALTIRLFILAVGLLITFGAAQASFGAATIVIVNSDAAGVGFNDTTVVAPVGGNTGTTLGQQRLIAFQEAANIWGATLTSGVTIRIRAQWTALSCTASTATLGSAGASQTSRDFPGAPFTSTLYSMALANKINGSDMGTTTATPFGGGPPVVYHINANFNVNLGLNADCLPGSPFYLGLNGLPAGSSEIDLVAVLLHEFGHGLGFQTFTSGTSGAFSGGFPTIFDRFMIDDTTGKSWVSMTNSERQASALNSRKLAWDGPQVVADVPNVLALGIPDVKVNSPAGIAGDYGAGDANFGAPLTAAGVTADLLLANDGVAGAPGGTVTDGCEAFTANFFNGKIAMMDRGFCNFTVKAKNAQNAGAVGAIIVDNVADTPAGPLGGSDPTVTIPSVRVTQADGAILKNAMTSGTVNTTLKLDMSVRAGADPFNKALLYNPNPFVSGSSISHWDTIEFPNQLMEPAINDDLTHNVTPPSDLTFSLFRDIGWVASNLPQTLTKTQGDAQTIGGTKPYPLTLKVTSSVATAGQQVTWTTVQDGLTQANGKFPGSAKTVVTTTDAAGVATSPVITAGPRPGTFTVNATIPGAGTQTFTEVVTPALTAAGATVSGRVLAGGDRGLTNAVVTITDPDGTSRSVVTGRGGVFTFDDVESGRTYIISIGSQRFSYQPQTITVNDNVAGLTFIPN